MTKRALDTVVELSKRQKKLKQPTQDIRTGDILPSGPNPDLLVPSPYLLDSGHTYKVTVKDEEEEPAKRIIAHSPILITSIVQDIESDKESWELSWCRHGVWRRQTVDRDVCSDSRKIVGLSAFGFPINSGNARDLVEYLAKFEAVNLSTLPVSHVTGHLGWQGRDGSLGFLFGHDWISDDDKITVSFRGADAGDEQIADGYHTGGTIEEWIQALKPAMVHDRARVAFYTSFVPVILHQLKCSNFVVDFAGRTSSGKTTLQRIAASVVGNPDEKATESALGTWDSTKVFIERASAVVTGLPVVLDDTKRAKNGKVVSDMLYSITNGRGRGRANIKGITRTGTWRTVLISSGEQPATSFTNDGGTRGRVLEIRGLPFGSSDSNTRRMVEHLNVDLMCNYGHGVPLFVRWVMKHKNQWMEWTKQYRDAIATYADSVTDAVAGRLGAYAAAIETTAALVHVAFAEEGYPLPWAYKNPLENLWEGIVREASDALGEEEALRDVASWAFGSQHSFYGRRVFDYEDEVKQPNGGWLGRWQAGNSWTFIAFANHHLIQFLTKQGYNPVEILSSWRERGWIDVPANQKGYQKMLRMDGQRQWFIVLKREAIDGIE